MSGEIKRNLQRISKAFVEIVLSEPEFTIWNGNELVIRINKKLGQYKIPNIRCLRNVFNYQNKVGVFRRNATGTRNMQYIFIRLHKRERRCRE